MTINDPDVDGLVTSQSLNGVIYQAQSLINELNKINDEEFPREARLVRDVFLCIAEHILEELREIYDPERPFKLGPDKAPRVRGLAKYLREIHSYIRYLSASSPRQSPPAVQQVLAQLTQQFFPKQHGEPVCIVRPQWTYNLKCVPLAQELRKISAETLDWHNKLGLKPGESIIPALWNKRLKRLKEEGKKTWDEKVPTQIGILSFAAIDTLDALSLPLLGHELGHFIAFSPPTPSHEDPELLRSADISEDRVRDIIEDVTGNPASAETSKYYYILRRQILICLRELLADRLAARMLGFSFFLAESKFIKTVLPWYKPLILESGYPNIKLRLTQIFDQVTADGFAGNPMAFLRDHSHTQPEISGPLLTYLQEWKQHLDALPTTVYSKSELISEELLVEPLYQLVEAALNPKTLEILSRIAEQIIPNEKCARLTPSFFERIARLKLDLPPSLPAENENSFSEIMSAAWAYQVIFGENRENLKRTANKDFDEHSKTCRLTLKAIELLPVQENISISSVDQGDPRRPISKSMLAKITAKIIKHPERSKVSKLISDLTQPRDVDIFKRKGVLSYDDISKRTLLPIDHSSHIGISPLRQDKINGASINLHLGNWFAYARRTKLKGIRMGDLEDELLLRSTGQGEAFVPFGKTFLLHPGDLALGVTQEFIAVPNDLIAAVEGRSGLGRLGLFIATATQIAPGFHGVIVLELVNSGTVPLELKPGLEIAQLVFQALTHPVPDEKSYQGKYYCQIKPLI